MVQAKKAKRIQYVDFRLRLHPCYRPSYDPNFASHPAKAPNFITKKAPSGGFLKAEKIKKERGCQFLHKEKQGVKNRLLSVIFFHESDERCDSVKKRE